MCRRVRSRRSIDIDAVNPIETIECVGQMHQVIFDIGSAALTGFEIVRGRAHEECTRPQRTQIKIEFTVVIDKQRATTLPLQYRFRGLGLQAKIGILPL